jgi:lipoteichoic acid synthase
VSSWGVDERVVCDRLAAWLGEDAGGGAGGAGRRPWFAELLTVSTHHPYAAPGVPDRLSEPKRYAATLGFTDEVLDGLLQTLARRGQLARTIVLVTGDHGEAFANWHALNLTHRNYLYEENVKSFLLVLSPALAGAPAGQGGGLVSERVATMGDVLPTALAVLGEGAAGMPGQSLWPDAYSPRIAFFSKNTQPEQWGLRDGRFKFIARVGGDKRLELYDLDQDPDEQSNLAAAQIDRAMLYDRLCARWFASATADYKARLAPGKDP